MKMLKSFVILTVLLMSMSFAIAKQGHPLSEIVDTSPLTEKTLSDPIVFNGKITFNSPAGEDITFSKLKVTGESNLGNIILIPGASLTVNGITNLKGNLNLEATNTLAFGSALSISPSLIKGNNLQINGIADGTDPNSVVTKKYVDDKVGATGWTLNSGVLTSVYTTKISGKNLVLDSGSISAPAITVTTATISSATITSLSVSSVSGINPSFSGGSAPGVGTLDNSAGANCGAGEVVTGVTVSREGGGSQGFVEAIQLKCSKLSIS